MHAAHFVATIALLLASPALAAQCSSNKVNGGDTACAQRIADRMCSQLSCDGNFDQAEGGVHVQGVMSNGACPNNCANAVADILDQCIANRWDSGTWQLCGEWYWIYSIRNSPAGSAGC
ncbi:hypothetical protein MVEN_01891500 [Mycena venus]|uniref:Uncharacterized protein n=1 Tax=Mycena venus TaxID=2733690 RepID=A0A8H6XHC7_9AGAR|nr:hypothetical protein MVEN_01891500 [Mycena venus]